MEDSKVIVGISSINIIIGLGIDLSKAVESAIVMAKGYDCKIHFVFNGNDVNVTKDSIVDDVVTSYNYERGE